MVYRLAGTSPESPGSWQSASFDTYRTTSQEINTGELTPTYGTPREMWIQFGLQFILTSGTFGQATVLTSVAVRNS